MLANIMQKIAKNKLYKNEIVQEHDKSNRVSMMRKWIQI
jgi:hypothetical protein